jgi:hypothetical protein
MGRIHVVRVMDATPGCQVGNDDCIRDSVYAKRGRFDVACPRIIEFK